MATRYKIIPLAEKTDIGVVMGDKNTKTVRQDSVGLHARWRLLMAGTTLVALSGCMSLAPEHNRPEAPVPQTYSADFVDYPASGQPVPMLPWRTYFTDPLLQSLIETALDNNRDLRQAILRVEEAGAAFRILRGDRFPEVSVGGQGARSRMPGDLSGNIGQPMVGGEYRAEVGLSSWELDLWGRVRNLETSALESWLATDAARRAVQVSLIAEVADGYLGLRELDERVGIARRTVATHEDSYRIFQLRYDVGATSKLDAIQVQTLLTQAQALLAQLEQQRAQQINALRLLVGGNPQLLPQQAPFDKSNILAPITAGLPSDLLIQRPDIVAAEHRLRAANANIGAARAAFLPRIALTGSFGTASAELDGLFESGSRAWAFVPTLSLPIFDGGRRRANLELSEVRRDIAVAEYEQSIQIAFREVADALAARHWLSRQLEVTRVARDVQAERVRLAQLRYDHGSSAYLEVLDAQRDLLETEQQLVVMRREMLSSQISLYSALGGGGPDEAPSSPSSPSTTPDIASVNYLR